MIGDAEEARSFVERLTSSIEYTNSPNSRKLQYLPNHLPFSALGKIQILVVNLKDTKATLLYRLTSEIRLYQRSHSVLWWLCHLPERIHGVWAH